MDAKVAMTKPSYSDAAKSLTTYANQSHYKSGPSTTNAGKPSALKMFDLENDFPILRGTKRKRIESNVIDRKICATHHKFLLKSDLIIGITFNPNCIAFSI